MALRTPAEYVESLRDDRSVFFEGARVPDVTEHPVIARAIRHAATDFELAEDPAARDLAVVDGPDGPYSRYFADPAHARGPRRPAPGSSRWPRPGATPSSRSSRRSAPTPSSPCGGSAGGSTPAGRTPSGAAASPTTWPSAATATSPCRSPRPTSRATAALGPNAQADPEAYLRIVERRPDGIVVRGAKVHTSCTPNANELIVLPTRVMGPDDGDWAVSFAIPIATARAPARRQPLRLADGHVVRVTDQLAAQMMETTTIFDDVFVPERAGVPVPARPTWPGRWPWPSSTTTASPPSRYKQPLVDALVGAAP